MDSNECVINNKRYKRHDSESLVVAMRLNDDDVNLKYATMMTEHDIVSVDISPGINADLVVLEYAITTDYNSKNLMESMIGIALVDGEEKWFPMMEVLRISTYDDSADECEILIRVCVEYTNRLTAEIRLMFTNMIESGFNVRLVSLTELVELSVEPTLTMEVVNDENPSTSIPVKSIPLTNDKVVTIAPSNIPNNSIQDVRLGGFRVFSSALTFSRNLVSSDIIEIMMDGEGPLPYNEDYSYRIDELIESITGWIGSPFSIATSSTEYESTIYLKFKDTAVISSATVLPFTYMPNAGCVSRYTMLIEALIKIEWYMHNVNDDNYNENIVYLGIDSLRQEQLLNFLTR